MQKQIVSEDPQKFEAALNSYFEKGWTIVPNTSSVAATTCFNSYLNQTKLFYVCSATIEI